MPLRQMTNFSLHTTFPRWRTNFSFGYEKQYWKYCGVYFLFIKLVFFFSNWLFATSCTCTTIFWIYCGTRRTKTVIWKFIIVTSILQTISIIRNKAIYIYISPSKPVRRATLIKSCTQDRTAQDLYLEIGLDHHPPRSSFSALGSLDHVLLLLSHSELDRGLEINEDKKAIYVSLE